MARRQAGPKAGEAGVLVTNLVFEASPPRGSSGGWFASFRGNARRVHPSTVWPPRAALKAGRLGDTPSP